MSKNRLLDLVKKVAGITEDKKAEDIVILDLRGKSALTDFFILCSVTNTRQARAIAQDIEERLKKIKERPDHIEGYTEGLWILMDYTDFIVHIFTRETREYYDLEHLWGDAPIVDVNS